MATLVENKICNACGSKVRPNALFCYHCGGSLAPEVIAVKDVKAVSDAQFRGNAVEEKNGDKSAPIERTTLVETADKPIPKPSLLEEPKLKSAAAMRRKSKNLQPKRVEIIWEEYENAPNVWFILAAILLALFAFGALYLALQYK